MSAPKIVICYRRDDAAGHAGRLHDRLSARFGVEQVFMDIDAIEPGVDFTERIAVVIEDCSALLVIIGPQWLQMRDRQGNRRLDASDDYVRTELETALSHGVRVIPVLVNGATMPSPEELPPSVTQLAHRNAAELSDVRWHYDVDRLANFLGALQGEPAMRAAPPRAKTGKTPARSPTRVSRLASLARSRLLARKILWLSLIPLGAVAVAIGIIAFMTGGRDGGPVGLGALLGRRIAFVSDRDGGQDLWSMRTDGSDPLRLTRDSADLNRPDWSPDGKWIAFPSDRDGDLDIWITKADGSSLRQLTNHPAVDSAPSWSPDGRRVMFGSERGGADSEIWIVDVEGTGLRQLTDNDADDDAPDWSPAGTIAFESDRDGDYELYTMRRDGANVRQVTSNTADDFFPDWSPDGGHIAFRSDADGDYDIYTVASDGSELRKLTANDASDHRPAWSGDGAFIFFDSDINGNRDIYRTSIDGTGLRRLTKSGADDSSPAV